MIYSVALVFVPTFNKEGRLRSPIIDFGNKV